MMSSSSSARIHTISAGSGAALSRRVCVCVTHHHSDYHKFMTHNKFVMLMVCETEAKALSPLAKISNNVPVSPLIASLNTNFMYVEFNYNEKYSLFCGSRIFEKHNNHRSNQRERVGE